MNSGAAKQNVLVGNRLMLAGAVLYLLEWVAIVAASVGVPLGADANRSDLLNGYAGHSTALGWAAGWFSVALLGRILMMVGLRSALRDSGRPHALMDFAVSAMAVSVALEIATYAIPAGASWFLSTGGDVGVVRGLDAVSFVLNGMIWGPLGVAVLCCGVAMMQSRLFPVVLCLLALLAGVGGTLAGIAFQAPSLSGAAGAATTVAALPFWVWMIWTGILLWRSALPRSAMTTPAVPSEARA